MKYPERTAVVNELSYESRLGFIAFEVERLLNEAQRHPAASRQLAQLPSLTEGLQLLWDRAEKGSQPAPETVQRTLADLATFDTPEPARERVAYNYDVTLVQAARMLRKGLELLIDPTKTPRYVAGALEGPVQAVGVMYADYQAARNAEVDIADTALLRLKQWGNKPFSREVFKDIPEWPRGELSRKYAAGQVKGEGEEDDADC